MNPFTRSSPPRRAPVWLTLLTLLTLGASFFGCSARADDVVRQVQEELRKRNLYFGDVDGSLSAPTAAALRRYQQRKGFAPTGQTDAVTLQSLMIPLPPGVAAPDPAARPSWPDITVLRSDERRRLPPGADADPDAARAPVPSPPAAKPTPNPPPVAATRQRITEAEARAFIERYLQAGQANDPKAETAFYADRVDYFNEGVVDRPFIEKDIARYDRRWPERRFTLLAPFAVAPSPDGDSDRTVVSFRYEFSNKGAKYRVGGKTDNTWTLAGATAPELRIVAVKEQRVRE